MITQKWLIPLVLSILLCGLLTGCDSPPPPEPVKIVIMADELRTPILQGLVPAFAAEHNVTVEIQQVDFHELLATYKTAVAAGSGPDVVVGPHDWVGELVASGYIAPIELESRERANFLPSATFGFTYDRQLYGLPYAVENVALLRNTDLVPDAPRTWAEVAEIAAALEAEGKVTQGFVLHADAYHSFPIHTAFGGQLFGWDSAGQYDRTNVLLDSAQTIAAAQWIETLARAGHLDGEMTWERMHALFESGEAALLITGPWALERIRESGIPYAISALPEQEAAGLPFVGVQGFMVSARSNHPELAQTFVTEFVLSESVLRALYEGGLRPSAYLPLRATITDPDLAQFAAVGSNGLPMPSFPEMSAIWDAWEVALDQILRQETDAATAYQNAAEEIRAILK